MATITVLSKQPAGKGASMKNLVFFIGMALLLHGCSYAISDDIVEQTDKSIKFTWLLTEPHKYQGKIVIVGGTIADIKSTKKGTLIEVVERPLDYWGKPKRTEQIGGRFMVNHPRLLDRMVYSPGREITVAGEVTGTYEKSLEQIGSTYPLLISKELKLWEREKTAQDSPRWMDPLNYDPSGRGRSVYH